MSDYNGILNDNGSENELKIFIDLNKKTSYNTNFCVDDISFNAIVEPNKIIVQDKIYHYYVKKCVGEVIIAGKEEPNILHWFLPCIYRQIFFVVTDKEK